MRSRFSKICRLCLLPFSFPKVDLFLSLSRFLSLSVILHDIQPNPPPHVYIRIQLRFISQGTYILGSEAYIFFKATVWDLAVEVLVEKPTRKKKMAVEEISRCAQKLHVLAVDDSLVDRKVIERLLKISCCKVTALESGSRALQYLGLDGERGCAEFDGLNVNLIITDYSMPGMTGYELLKKIKGSTKLSKIPVVIMSSENVLSRIDRCLEEGAEDFLVKPVKLSDVERLREVMLKGEEDRKERVGCSRKRKTRDDSCSSSLDCGHAFSSISATAMPHHQPLQKRPRLI